jgi:hypothetical protein
MSFYLDFINYFFEFFNDLVLKLLTKKGVNFTPIKKKLDTKKQKLFIICSTY